MFKTASGSALIAMILSTMLSHGGHAWMGGPPPPPGAPDVTSKQTGKDHYSPDKDAEKCYAFEAVLRHLGLEMPRSTGAGHPAGLACDQKAFDNTVAEVFPKDDPTHANKTAPPRVKKKGAKTVDPRGIRRFSMARF